MTRLVLTTAAFLFLFAQTAFNQWTLCNGPYGGDIPTMVYHNKAVYAGTFGGGIFSSTNNGKNWNYVGLKSKEVLALYSKDTFLFAGTFEGVYRSSDNGKYWIEFNNEITGKRVTGITYHNNFLFASTFMDGVFRSSDLGISWEQINNGITHRNTECIVNNSFDNCIYACAWGDVYYSNDNGANWKSTNFPKSAYSITFINNYIFVGSLDGIYYSTDKQTWQKIDNNLTTFQNKCFLVKDNVIYAGTYGDGIVCSSDLGKNWQRLNNGLIDKKVMSMIEYDGNLMAGTAGSLYFSSDMGKIWSLSINGILWAPIYALDFCDSKIFAGTYGGGVYMSSDYGNQWLQANNGLEDTQIEDLKSDNKTIYVRTVSKGLIKSEDFGYTWVSINSNFQYDRIRTIVLADEHIAVSTENKNIFYSSDKGNSWVQSSLGYTPDSAVYLVQIGKNILASTKGISYLSEDYGKSWSEISSLKGSNIYYASTIDSISVLNSYDGFTYYSTNLGKNWYQQNNKNYSLYNISNDGKNFYALDGKIGFCISTDYGQTWEAVTHDSLITFSKLNVASNKTHTFIGTLNGNILVAKNSDLIKMTTPFSPEILYPKQNSVDVPKDTIICWKSVVNSELYDLEISKTSSMDSFVVQKQSIADTFALVNLENSSTYYFRVRAGNGIKYSQWSQILKFQTSIGTPNKPKLLSPDSASSKIKIDSSLSWNKVSSATRYDLEISKSSDMSNSVLSQTITDTVFKFNLEKFTQYYWRVRADNGVNKSLWSNVWSFVTRKDGMLIDIGSDTTICPGKSVQIGKTDPIAGGVPPYKYKWSPGTGLSDETSPNPIATPSKTTLYTLTVSDSQNDTASASITVNVDDNIPKSVLIIDDISRNPKESIKYGERLILRAKSGNLFSIDCKPTSLKATIKTDKNLFFSNSGLQSTWDAEWVYMTKELPLTATKNGDILVEFDGTILLGDTTYAKIIIDTVIWIGGSVDATYEPGSITLTGIHEANGSKRLLKFNWGAKILNITPNPANDKVTLEIETPEPGDITVVVYSNLGIEISRYNIQAQKTRDSYNIELPETMNSGTYLIKLIDSGLNSDSRLLIMMK